MSVLAFLAITFGAGAAGLLTRRRPTISISIGLLGLAVAVIAGLLVSPGDRLVVGESALVATDFMHLFIVFGSVAALALCVMALAADAWQRNLSSAMLLGLGALALGLALADPVAGLAATAAAGLPGVLVAITTPVDARGVRSAARELRAVAVTGALALVAAALVSGPSGLVNLPVTVVGLAYLAMAIAVAVRVGAIPFHTRVARVTGSAPTAALPLLLALAPAGFASAALVWIDGNIATTALPLDAERAVIIVVGLLCLLLGVLAATIQDDIEHVVGYSVIQDAGFVLLALAVFDPLVWEPARTWLLIYVVTKSAFAGWALAMRASFGTSRIGEISGWIRRAPLLAVTLAIIVAATVGIPGLLVFDVRSRIATLSLDSPLAFLAIVGGLASLLYYGRLARVGIGPVAPLVAAYPGVWPRGARVEAAGAASDRGRARASAAAGEVAIGPDVGAGGGAAASRESAAAGRAPATDGPAGGDATARVRRERRALRAAMPLPLDLDTGEPGEDVASRGDPGLLAGETGMTPGEETPPAAGTDLGAVPSGAEDPGSDVASAWPDGLAASSDGGDAARTATSDEGPTTTAAPAASARATAPGGGGVDRGASLAGSDSAADDDLTPSFLRRSAGTRPSAPGESPAAPPPTPGPPAAPRSTAAGTGPSAATDEPTSAPDVARRPRESAAEERPPSVRGPRIDPLRRDPKELTQAWAREALERAGLAPPSAEGGAQAPSSTGAPATHDGSGASPGSPATPGAPGAGPTRMPRSGPADPRAAGSAAEPAGEGGSDASAPVPSDRDPQRATASPARRAARPAALRPTREPVASGGPGARGRARAAWEANRLLVVALLALGLSVMGLAAAAGAFGVSDAARAQAPAPSGDVFVPGDQGGEPVAPGGQDAPDATPGATPDPGTSLGPTGAPEPGSTAPSASEGSAAPGEGAASPGGTAAP